MNPEPVTYWFCGKCEQDYNNEMEAEECCGGSPEPVHAAPPTAAELEALGQQRLIRRPSFTNDPDVPTGCADDIEYELSDALKRLGEDGLRRLLNKDLHK